MGRCGSAAGTRSASTAWTLRWTVREEIELPGIPYGVAAFEGSIRIVVSIGEADDRYIYHFVPGQPFSEDGRVECPDLTGSHLTSDGTTLYLVQQTNRRILELNAGFTSKREIPLTTRCAGAGFSDSGFHMIAADAEIDVLDFATLDLNAPGAEPHKLASMNVEARGLAFDGTSWWTCRREDNLVVSFEG